MAVTGGRDRQMDFSLFMKRLLSLAGAVERWPLSLRLCVVALAVLGALVLRVAFFSSQGEEVYITFYPVVAIALVVAGLAGGALATALSVLVVHLWINPYDRREEWEALAAFLIGGAVMAFAFQILRRALVANLGREFRRRRNAQLRAIVDTALEGIVTTDRNGVIQYVNPAGQQMYGYAMDEMIGRNVRMLMPEPDSIQHDRYIANYLRTGEKKIIGQRRRVLGLRKNGGIFAKELTVTQASFDDDEILFVGMMRDLSAIEREKARADSLRDELAHASRLTYMSEVVGGLAHEVGQPLTAIANFLAAARRRTDSGETSGVNEMIFKAEEQARRACDILIRLRGFIEKNLPERRPEDLQLLIEAALALAWPGDAAQGQRVGIRKVDRAIEVNVDRVQIQQVLVNFLHNAAESTQGVARPEIVVETMIDKPGFVRVSVEDNGSGIDPEVAEKLFEPFVSTKKFGMGVGLSLCKSIIESHGGEIGYHAVNPHGAIFFFTLPILPGPCSAALGHDGAAASEP